MYGEKINYKEILEFKVFLVHLPLDEIVKKCNIRINPIILFSLQ